MDKMQSDRLNMSKKNDITLLRVNYLRGPNVWTYRQVLEVWLDLGELEDWPSHKLPGFNARLTALLPALVEHHCGVGERGGFVQRLEEGTWAGHILEHVIIELLNLSGMPTGFGQTRSTSQRGVYRMVFRARDEQVARLALAEGHALLMAAINDEPFDVPAAVARLRNQIDDCYLGPSTAAIVGAATDRGIPHIRLNDGNLVQLGHGRAQRRIWTAETDKTSAIAEAIAGDKDLTKTLLKSCGVPVPEGEVVDSPEAAWEAAQDIGLPVVVKPLDGNHGRGVSLELTERADIEAAFKIAEAEGSEVIVERYVRGDEHRLLIVGGKMVAAAKGESLWITGNGRDTVLRLIEDQLNSDPRRGDAEEFPLETIVLDREPAMCLLLQRQGLGPDAVPADGQRVLVQRNGNMAFDCTDEVHPEVAYMAGLATRAVGLDIAGIDMVTTDIGQPLHAVGGAIVEVNAGPGLLMHLKPAIGQPRPVGEAIVRQLFPSDDPMAGRIPLVGVAGETGSTLLARATAHLLGLGLGPAPTGLACREGIYLGRRRLEPVEATGYWHQCERLLMNREIRSLVVQVSAGLILDHGLPYDRCLVGVVTDTDGWEALERHDVHGPDDMPRALRTQVDVVLDQGACVLNLDRPEVVALGRHCDGAVYGYGLTPPPAEAGIRRLARPEEGAISLVEEGVVIARAKLAGATSEADRLSLAGAAAAAWAAGLAPGLIVAGLERFDLPVLA
mgnify:CR=1 FL=1